MDREALARRVLVRTPPTRPHGARTSSSSSLSPPVVSLVARNVTCSPVAGLTIVCPTSAIGAPTSGDTRLAGLLDGGLHALGPGLAVPAQDGAGLRRGQRVQGPQVALAVDGRRPGHEPGPLQGGVRVERDDGVSGDDGVAVGQVERAVAVGVAGREDDAR